MYLKSKYLATTYRNMFITCTKPKSTKYDLDEIGNINGEEGKISDSFFSTFIHIFYLLRFIIHLIAF